MQTTLRTLFSLLLLAALPTRAAEAARPNIVSICSDDHARNAIPACGSRVNEAPHPDRPVREGARLVNSFVVNSICTPGRATLLTGQYSHLNGVPVLNRFDGMRDQVAKRFQAGVHQGRKSS